MQTTAANPVMPSDAAVVKARKVIHDALEERLVTMEDEIRAIVGSDAATRWHVIASALYSLSIEVMAYMEPDTNRYVTKLRNMPELDDELLRAFHAKVRKDFAPAMQ